MFRSLFSRRGAVALAAASIGAASLSLAAAGTAGASVPNASFILGSGSQTSYATMTSLSDLFNGAPGCDLTASTSLPLALNCGTSSTTAGTAGGEQGFNVSAENPYNDFTVQAPAVGSGNGATQLIDAGAGSPTTSGYTVSYSRASAHKGNTTDNDVQYATDGVSWSTFAKTSAGATPQAKITTLTLSQLSSIWLGTESCVIGGVTFNMDWKCLGAKTSSPIDVYVAQTGSGTYSTWSSALGFTGATPAGVTCSTCEAGWPTTGTDPQTGLPYASDSAAQHSNIFENQMSTISSRPDAADAIYFFSFGRFTDTCPGAKFKKNTYTAVCAGTPKTDTTLLGAIGGVPATKATIQGTGGGAGVTFPVTRGLYNLYNNSSATVPSSQATLNFMSEKGFLCKGSTTTDIDPQTGVAYRTEIESAITANGFFPLDVSGTTFAQGSVTFPAVISDPAYTAVDSAGVNGFCLATNG
jgi:hypothetical protein